jgi:hypothetical protein
MHNVCYIHFSNPASVPGVDPISMNLLGGFVAGIRPVARSASYSDEPLRQGPIAERSACAGLGAFGEIALPTEISG